MIQITNAIVRSSNNSHPAFSEAYKKDERVFVFFNKRASNSRKYHNHSAPSLHSQPFSGPLFR